MAALGLSLLGRPFDAVIFAGGKSEAEHRSPRSARIRSRQNGTGENQMARKALVRMSIRILDKDGAEIASFFRGEPGEVVPGFSDGLRDALLGFRKQYPKTRFIDVEFTEES